jgi:hypothetical protein
MPPAILVMPPPIESRTNDGLAESITADVRGRNESPEPLMAGDIETSDRPPAGTTTFPRPIDDPEAPDMAP